MKKNRPRPRPEKKPLQAPTEALAVRVDDVAFGGDGVTRQDGKVIFVRGSVPGEHVRIALTENKKNFAKAYVIEKMEEAPDAVPPFCPVFQRCGGCDWQQVPYAKQLIWKAGFIETALRKIAGIERKVPIIPSPADRAYRNRIRLKGSIRDRLELGYMAKSSHDLVPIRACPIADPRIDQALAALHRLHWKGQWRGELEIQVLADASCLLHFTPPLPRELEKAVTAELDPQVARVSSPGFFLLEEDQGARFFTQAGQFQQVNVPANRQLRTWVKERVESIGAASVIDLFCGSGNFSLLLKGRRVWGLEIAAPAIATAQHNIQENQINSSDYKAGPAHAIRQIFPDLPDTVDCLITDPPRQGMAESIDDVIALKARDILSISCDPNTFARDLKALMGAGYEIVEIFGVDFFPQTYHVETVAQLRLRQ